MKDIMKSDMNQVLTHMRYINDIKNTITLTSDSGEYRTGREIRSEERARLRKIIVGISKMLNRVSQSRKIKKSASDYYKSKAIAFLELEESLYRLEPFLDSDESIKAWKHKKSTSKKLLKSSNE